jgi:hypothetical protein
MTELEPLKKITKEPEKVQEVKKTETKQEEKSVEKVVEKQPETFNLLRKINGELFFELEFPTGKLVVSEGKCSQLIPEFKKMTAEQKETFLMQAAIFGANPFSVPPEIYPLPFKQQDNSTTYAPVISAKKYVEKGMENPKFDGMKSGIVVEKQDGSFDFRKGQIYGKTEILKGINIEEVLNRKSDGTPNKFWKEKPALMIEKVAQKQAMEIAMQMPKTYIEEELPIDTTYEDLSGQKAISENNKEFFETK